MMNINDSYIDRYLNSVMGAVTHNWGDSARSLMKDCLYDFTGVLLGGSQVLKNDHLKYLEACSCIGEFPVYGNDKPCDMYSATLLNSMSAHALELDDGSRLGMLHPSVAIIPALLSAAYLDNPSGESFMRGMYAGYDAMIRLGLMVQSDHKKYGFHATGTCGSVGAAVAVSVMRGYGVEKLKLAVSIALTSASGLLEMIASGSSLKPYNAGHAAMSGLFAANLARCSYDPPKDALGGERGFLRTLNRGLDKDKFESALAMKYCTETVYHKAYASCRHLHSPVEAALKLHDLLMNDTCNISKVQITTYDLAIYGHDSCMINNASDAKMSMPYAVAAALLYGKAGIDAFDNQYIHDNQIKSLMNKIEIKPNAKMSAMVPSKRVAEVSVYDIAGKLVGKNKVEYPKGEPENPLTSTELQAKFYELVSFANADVNRISELTETINKLEKSNMNEYITSLKVLSSKAQ